MAFFPASCDHICGGCEKNSNGWCIYYDRATDQYKSERFEAKPYTEEDDEWVRRSLLELRMMLHKPLD